MGLRPWNTGFLLADLRKMALAFLLLPATKSMICGLDPKSRGDQAAQLRHLIVVK